MIARGAEAVRQCEARLRELMADAAAAGQYEAVGTLMGWARTVGSILEPTTASLADDKTPVEPRSESDSSAKSKVTLSTSRARKTKASRSQYPRFGRYRSELVKTGWSKKDKKEYQHRAPRQVVDLLCTRLSSFRGKDFTSDEVLPLEGDDGHEIPS